MVDSEKQENLANARRKLKKFRDQQQRQNGSDYTLNSVGNNENGAAFLINGASNDSVFNRSSSETRDVTSFVEEQQAILNGLHENFSKSPIVYLEEQNRQYELLLESQKQQRSRLEDQRQLGIGSSMSGRSSQNLFENEFSRHGENKVRRDFDHLQEQLEIHIQTIAVLVAEKSDLAAKLTQTQKQVERKQSEIYEVTGRLKASQERVDELERHSLNSNSNAQKREIEARESDKEIDRLKIENNRQSQTIEDLKENLKQQENKFKQKQTTVDQLNVEIEKLKQQLEHAQIRVQQFQSLNDMSLVDSYEQRITELQQLIQGKSNEIEALLATIQQMRSDNDQTQIQYQQYNSNVQRHISELNEQIRQLTETNVILENEREAMKKSHELKLIELQDDKNQEKNTITNDLLSERDSLQDENQLLKSAINEWSVKFQSMRLENEKLTSEIIDKDQQLLRVHIDLEKLRENAMEHENLLRTVQEDKATISRAIMQNKQLKEQLAELQDGFVKLSNDKMNLTTRFQTQEHLNKQLEERLAQQLEQSTNLQIFPDQKQEISANSESEEIKTLTENLKKLAEENDRLKEEINQRAKQQTTKIVDQRSNEFVSSNFLISSDEEKNQLEDGFIEKIINRFNRAMRDNADLQDRTQQMEHLILQLQSETETIGDYISLYQQQRQQLHRRYQEKDEYIKQLTNDRLSLQKKLSELETILLRALNQPSNSIPTKNSISNETVSESDKTLSTDQPAADENDWPEIVENSENSSSNRETNEIINNDDSTTLSNVSRANNAIPEFDDQTKQRILTLLKELGEVDSASATDHPSSTKLAFVGKNLYVCSTCTGPVQWV